MRFELFNPVSFFSLLGEVERPLLEHMARMSSGVSLDGIDVLEDETAVKILMDVPGLKREDIRIQVSEGLLTIRCHREPATSGILLRGRPEIDIDRAFNIGEMLDPESVVARCTDGVLEITLKKRGDASRTIEVQ